MSESQTQTTVVSFGGGVNSTALLIGLEERGERPDFILFADTAAEKPETYKHVERIQQWLADHDMPEITTVMEKNGLEDDCLARETLPGKAFGFGSCSERYKVRPQRRWLKEQGVTDVMWLVGIHYGERKRAQRQLNQRIDVRFPLIEWRWDQVECVEAIQCAGLPVPVKSACFFCPAMKKPEVIELSQLHPDLFNRAVEIEQAAIESGKLTTVKGLGRRWSWEELVRADQEQAKLFTDEQAPLCEACIDV